MKITSDTLITELQRSANSGGSQSAGGSFQDMLVQAMGEDQAGGVSQTTAAGSATSSGETGLPPVWFQVSGVLESLEAYGQALGDSRLSMKDLEPLAQDLEQQAQELADNLDEDAAGPLQDLGNQVLAQARMAAIQYRRGDYV